MDATDNNRATSAQMRAPRDTRRAQASGGDVWGQRLVFLGLVTPTISLPVGVAFSQPAPALRAGDQQDKALKQQGVPNKPRPSPPPANPLSPTTPALALSLLAQFKTQHPHGTGNGITADALYGPAPFGDGAAAMVGGVPGIAPSRSHQTVRLQKRAQHVSDSCTTHPGTSHPSRIRGGPEGIALVGSARFYVCAQKTTRFVVALHYVGEATSRDLIASDLTWRTRAMVQGQTLRWLVAGCLQAWQA